MSLPKTIFLLIITFIVGTASIGVLLIQSRHHTKNDFFRFYNTNVFETPRILDLAYNSYYIAGHSAHTIFLGNVTAPGIVLKTNTTLSDTTFMTLKINNATGLRAPVLKTDSSNFYLMDGGSSRIITGSLKTFTAHSEVNDSLFFANAQPLSPHSYILRSFDNEEYVLRKKSDQQATTASHSGILEKQIDGVFCTDGTLLYDQHSKQLCYLYYYRNQFITLDTSLQIKYRGRTIDTTTHARIKTVKIVRHDEVQRTMASPPTLVNKRGSISNNLLFVQSNLMADNDGKDTFRHATVIDIYSLKTGAYLSSLSIADFGNEKVSDFQVFDDVLVALFDRYIHTYQLHLDNI